MTAFVNEPLLELRSAGVREKALHALAHLERQGPIMAPPRIGDRRLSGAEFDSIDPADPSTVVARVQAANAEDALGAVEIAASGQEGWAALSTAARAETLRSAAGILRDQRLELAALAVREAGKPWPEADADVAEAIDFLVYYAARAEELSQGRSLIQLPGERNRLYYAPRGPTAVIAPWNFPFAIPCGMTSAALVAGNSVVLKPAEQTPACADALVHALHRAGVPKDALILLPGGDEPARALVRDPRVATIAFTGSSAAGLSILRAAAEVSGGQKHLKKVVAEMGGKNCILVDADADLDDVIPGVIKSAFGFAGQKCSAASRLLVHRDIAAALTERLEGSLATLRIGVGNHGTLPTSDHRNSLGRTTACA